MKENLVFFIILVAIFRLLFMLCLQFHMCYKMKLTERWCLAIRSQQIGPGGMTHIASQHSVPGCPRHILNIQTAKP